MPARAELRPPFEAAGRSRRSAVTVYTREPGDGHVLYAPLVAPARDYDRWGAASGG
jgi:hypothetical protein